MDDIAREHGFEITPPMREAIFREQTRLSWFHLALGGMGAVVFAFLFVLFLRDEFPVAILTAWFAVKVVTMLPRVAIGFYLNYRGHMPPHMEKWVCASVAVDGAVWGVASAYAVQSGNLNVVMTVCAGIAALAAAGTQGLMGRMVVTLSFATPVVVPLTVSLLARGDRVGLYAGVCFAMLAMLMIASARTSQMRLTRSVILKVREAEVNSQLKRALDREAEARTQLQDALSREAATNARLEESLKREERVNAQLSEALEQVNRESAAKSTFLQIVNQELRVPLHQISGIARQTRDGSENQLVRRRMAALEATSQQALRLVNDLLDLTELKRGAVSHVPTIIDLHRELNRVAAIYRVQSEERQLSFLSANRVPVATFVHADLARLQQVLHNLLGNALRFTKRGWIGMEAELVDDDGQSMMSMLRVVVSDTGVGIKPSHVARVFDAFFRGAHPQDDSATEGAGIGLAIAQEAARLLNGEIVFTSAVGRGSSFVFEAQLVRAEVPEPFANSTRMGLDGLPAPAEMDEVGHTVLEVPRNNFSARVLLVDDRDVSAMLTNSMLSAAGHVCSRVRTGEDAVRSAIAAPRFDMMLISAGMIGMDVLDVVGEVRRAEQIFSLNSMCIVAVTTSLSPVDEELLMRAGANAVLVAPFDASMLTSVMEHLSSRMPFARTEAFGAESTVEPGPVGLRGVS